MLLLLLLLAVVAIAVDTTNGHHAPLLDCAPEPGAVHAQHDRSFRANLASALAVLPPVAAAAPGRSATSQSVEAGPDGAFARGFYFGAAGDDDCLACLAAAAADVTLGCGTASRRAGCFLAYAGYADTAASSAHEDAFRGWFYAGPKTAGTLASGVGVCMGYRVTADCTRCLYDSLRAAPALGWLPRLRGEEVIVAGYSGCLRVQKQGGDWEKGSDLFGLWFCVCYFWKP